MPELLNPRWEKFCHAYLETGNASEAYRRAGYRHNYPIDYNAHRLSVNERVKARIAELRAQLVFNQSMSREELAGYFVAAIKTPAGEVGPSHPLCQAYETGPKGVKIRVPDKNAAAAGLARLAGWEAAQRVELSVDNPLTAYLRELRGKDVRTIDNQ